MKKKVRVVIIDDSVHTRESIAILLSLEKDVEVVGEGENGVQAIELARELKPDIILMDINMPIMDGMKATQAITAEGLDSSIIIMSIQGDKEYLKRAMTAGARDYIMKPFDTRELMDMMFHIYETDQKRRKKYTENIGVEKVPTKIISLFSTKGGVGKTTIATNLAVSIANTTKKKVALLDFNLQFGDAAISLDVYVKNTIGELIKDMHNIEQEPDLIEEYMLLHYSGVKVLAAPTKPEYAEYITPEHIKKIIQVLMGRYHYIIIDNPQSFQDTVLCALDSSDIILYVSTLDLPTIKNTKVGLEVMQSLNYSKEKVKVIINKSNEKLGIKHKDFENTLNVEIFEVIPEDNTTVITSVNKGMPFVAYKKVTAVAKSVRKLAKALTEDQQEQKGIIELLRQYV